MRIELHDHLPAVAREPLLDLWQDAWTPAMPAIDFVARRPWFSGHLDTVLADGAVLLLAREAERLVGFATLDPATGLIDQLAIHLHEAGRGYASALLAMAKRLRPSGLTLTVNTANLRALALYRRHGFVVTGDGVSPRSGLPQHRMDWVPAGPAAAS